MTQPTPSEPIFRFVAVRPPLLPAKRDTFISVETGVADSFLATALTAPTWAVVRQAAEEQIARAADVLDFQLMAAAPQLKELRSAVAAAAHVAVPADLDRLIGAPIGRIINDERFEATWVGIVDAYAAGCVLPSLRPGQRETALQSLRTLHLVTKVFNDPGVLSDQRRTARLLRARVVLPQALFQRAPARPDRKTSTEQAAQPDPRADLRSDVQLLQQLTRYRQELVTADRAHRRLLEVPRRHGAGSDPSQPPSPTPPRQPAGGELPLSKPRVTPNRSTRDLAPVVVDELSDELRDFLTAQDVPPTQIDVAGGLNLVDSAIQSVRARALTSAPLPLMLSVDRYLARTGSPVFDDALPRDLDGVPTVPGPDGDDTADRGIGKVRPLGIGDLLIVEQTLIGYQAGEISHVENVLQSESLSRTFRTRDRREDTALFATTTTEQTERDLQSTDRFELSSQAQTTISQDQSVKAGATVTASYGPVSVGAYGDFATGTSTTDATASATTFAQDITERSVTAISTRTREQQTSTVVHETEETTQHGFDNTAGAAHVTGIYQWLEKRYRAQVFRYGRRLMFEFLVPEPAAYYRFAQSQQAMTGVSLPEPEDPAALLPADLTKANYQDYAARYAVTGVAPPPPHRTILTAGFSHSGTRENTLVTETNSTLQVPAGYRARVGRFRAAHSGTPGQFLNVILGSRQLDVDEYDGVDVDLDGEDTTVPVGVIGFFWGYVMTVEIECERTDATFARWQQETYDAIMSGYRAVRSAYDSQVRSAGYVAHPVSVGGSEADNRRIEQEELKKSSLTMLAREHFGDFDSLSAHSGRMPRIDVDQAMTEGSYAQFLEQAFEWGQMTYLFYPYFWMNKDTWTERTALTGSDLQFSQFMRAGFARVAVPVTPAYWQALAYYLNSGGRIWNGGTAPTIDDPLYISIADELDDDVTRTPVGDAWPVVLPTNLVYLRADSSLPTFSGPTDE